MGPYEIKLEFRHGGRRTQRKNLEARERSNKQLYGSESAHTAMSPMLPKTYKTYYLFILLFSDQQLLFQIELM
jgi:hypothetical protein